MRMRARDLGASAVAAAPGGADRHVSLAVARWAAAVRAVGLVLDGDEWRCPSWLMPLRSRRWCATGLAAARCSRRPRRAPVIARAGRR
ncbi:hypothetical protein GCM10022416_61530 [Actinomadura keratinilytica]|uniref:Uncharacterized protein n=1 Tax=Actinomadura keratinilytica TaxID=547461 RepID=A0ABP6UKH2_9ACTN